MKIKLCSNSLKDQMDIETLSSSELEAIVGGNIILAETIIYWFAYAAGKAMRRTNQVTSHIPAEESGYAQTYRMGTF